MPVSQRFGISFLTTKGANDHLFLSVTAGFEHGPGIQRDGLTDPRMSDPHSVSAVVNSRGLDGREWRDLPSTTDAFVQRVGTWTLYQHLKRFLDTHGDNWQVVAIQSNGDLTMNYWHVAYFGPTGRKSAQLCGLRTINDPEEPLGIRTYRCLLKWRKPAADLIGSTYEFIDLRFDPTADEVWLAKIADTKIADEYGEKLKKIEGYNTRTRNIGPLVEFALSGKPIVENGIEVTLANAIDRFEDVRHIFNLPDISVIGYYDGHDVKKINFGEYQLFKNVNERRAALFSPVIIQLHIDKHVNATWKEVSATLIKRHFRLSQESPTLRGQFRKYTDKAVEIFFPHNVYPFGVLGLRPAVLENGQKTNEIVGLSSGGLSGRVGNTLEGTAQIMYDFFGCRDAIVLDEGFDVFSVINPWSGEVPAYSNEELLAKVLHFSRDRFEQDAVQAVNSCANYRFGPAMAEWPLNKELADELCEASAKTPKVNYGDVMVVPPHRSQMRSVLIFAVPKSSQGGKKTRRKPKQESPRPLAGRALRGGRHNRR